MVPLHKALGQDVQPNSPYTQQGGALNATIITTPSMEDAGELFNMLTAAVHAGVIHMPVQLLFFSL